MNTSHSKPGTDKSGTSPVTLSHVIGMACFTFALMLSALDVRLAVIPLVLFLLICFAAPFFPGFGFFLPIITRGKTDKKSISLTFDDGPDPVSTPALLALLAEKNVKATFFITGQNAGQYPDLIHAILRGGHTIGNHSYHHDPLIMLKPAKTLLQEIQRTQEILATFGIRPLVFRPPVGITNPKLGPILKQLGMYCVNYSCRAFDAGNRRIGNLADKILRKLKPGDIILLHDSVPAADKNRFVLDWLKEIRKILETAHRDNWEIIPLPDMIHRPVMFENQTVTIISRPGGH